MNFQQLLALFLVTLPVPVRREEHLQPDKGSLPRSLSTLGWQGSCQWAQGVVPKLRPRGTGAASCTGTGEEAEE